MRVFLHKPADAADGKRFILTTEYHSDANLYLVPGNVKTLCTLIFNTNGLCISEQRGILLIVKTSLTAYTAYRHPFHHHQPTPRTVSRPELHKCVRPSAGAGGGARGGGDVHTVAAVASANTRRERVGERD